MLSQNDYYNVCKLTHTPSIDLIIKHHDKYLVGRRQNNPAKGYYFVLGGVIQKYEKINKAIERISHRELGIKLYECDMKFHCVSQHWYRNNFKDDIFGTHYLSLSYIVELSNDQINSIVLDDQHSDIKFMTVNEILSDDSVHPYTKGFFDKKYFDINTIDIPKIL
jgi:colanic acid biosynthesis protein WcaH